MTLHMSSSHYSLYEEHYHLLVKYGNRVASGTFVCISDTRKFSVFIKIYTCFCIQDSCRFILFLLLFLIVKVSPYCLNCILAGACLLRLTACAFYQPVPADMSHCLSLHVYSETWALLAHWGVCVCKSEFVCRGFNSPQISGLRLAGSGGWPHWQISRSHSHSCFSFSESLTLRFSAPVVLGWLVKGWKIIMEKAPWVF